MNCDINFSNIAPMNYFERLPEGCKVEIISKTTPVDAVRSTILSKEFKSAAESTEIWGSFLPPDYQDIINRSEFPLVCNTKKELFFSLCDSPILFDGGKLCFSLDKRSGKKCFMIAPRELIILGSDAGFSWKWSKHPESRFSDSAYLRFAQILDIRGRIGTEMLSPKTEYTTYLVFKFENRSFGLESAISGIRFDNFEDEFGTEVQTNIVRFASSEASRNFPKMRGDGWLEVELGYFNSERGSDGPAEARVADATHIFKGGLVVEGIEFRPTRIEYRL